MSIAEQQQAKFAEIGPTVSTWLLDPAHSMIEFKVGYTMIANVRGEFTCFEGTLWLDSSDIAASRVAVQIEAAGIATRDPQRDAHLRSSDFFDVKQYPVLTFNSTRVAYGVGKSLMLAGELTIRNKTHAVVFEVQGPTRETRDVRGKTRIGLSASATINRKDFGLYWDIVSENGGVVVGYEVHIKLELEFVKQN